VDDCSVSAERSDHRIHTLHAVRPIAEGGFGVINRAEHELYGEVIYKALKTSKIADNTRSETFSVFTARCTLVPSAVL